MKLNSAGTNGLENQFLGVSDEDLFFRSEKERECFAELVVRHHGKFLGLAARIAGYQNAEDVLQDAFVRMMTFHHRFHSYPGSSFLNWAWMVVRNSALTHVEKAARQVPYEDGRLEDLIGGREPEDKSVELRQLGEKILALLPREYESVMQCRYWDDLGLEEIARGLKIPVGTVKSRLFRGRMHVARLLRRLTAR
ncbi:MAG: RNA polymerase sigma factor [Candidatus Sungbacteria bacterium]|uniref:RNA polymerase sigma factor n=1 Tax=Candidatus Sungiibacteriota bacterium TaxID=2750080 RepID=A0A9D6LNZ5_9BACT|nr:RNA polymerase sigma factor [Candidatus Sungbacteria bacterium]